MSERSKFFDDLAGVAGGAMSALSGLRDEAESTIRARVEEVIRKLDLVRRDDFEAVQEIAAKARAAQEALEIRVAVLEAKWAAASSPAPMSTPAAAPIAAAAGEPMAAPPTDSAEEPRPETPDLLAPKNAS